MKRNNSDDNGGGTENSAKRLEIDDLATQTIDLADLLTKHVTSSGSFDIRGGIWATTFGKLLQALPIPAVLVDRAFEVAAANEAWKKLGPGYTEALCGRFSELFGTPSAARKIQSAIEEVFRTRRAKFVEAQIRVRETPAIWARITFRAIRIVQERFLLALVEDLTAEMKQLALSKKHREQLEATQQQLEQKVAERTAQLTLTNESLRKEIEERLKAEEALKTVVAKIEEQLREVREDLVLKMRISLKPLIDQLKAQESSANCQLLIEAMDYHLENTFSSLGTRMSSKLATLSPREIQVCNLIASGLSSKQIADVVGVTAEAISHQRLNIRKKLGLDLSSASMATWLRQFYGFQVDEP